MEIIGFVLFLVISHFGAMQVFRLSTYHRYFWPSLPLLLGYAALVGWALFALNMHAFFLWQLCLASAWLFARGKKQNKTTEVMLQLMGDHADAVRFMADSAAKTIAYYTASSIMYVVGFSFVYLLLYNN